MDPYFVPGKVNLGQPGDHGLLRYIIGRKKIIPFNQSGIYFGFAVGTRMPCVRGKGWEAQLLWRPGRFEIQK